jgi:hypothetical protein
MRTRTSIQCLSTVVLTLASWGCSPSSPTSASEGAPGIRPDEGVNAQPLTGARANPGGAPDDLIVHEWGTFTAMAGSDGVILDGLHHASDRLPAFVHSNLPGVKLSPFHAFGDESFHPPARGVNSKMETPVLYFYTKTPQRVSVHVDFERGLLTEWYPQASRVTPEQANLDALRVRRAEGPLDIARIPRSSLDWDLQVTPFESGAPAAMPQVEADDPWQFAREVRAGYVTPFLKDGAAVAGEAEHYVFYRGLGRPSLPLSLRFIGGPILARNVSDAPIPFAVALQMSEAGGRFVPLQRFEAGAGAGAGQQLIFFPEAIRPKSEVIEAVGREVTKALVAEGLYEDEARAMIRTWSPTWFASEGTRVLYILPRSLTDAMLPIRITPTPQELVRVLVGRQEILMPEREALVEALLEARASADPARKTEARKGLARFGRFLEPAVRQTIASTQKETVRRSGAEVLAEIH